eukprot:gene2068-2554_t
MELSLISPDFDTYIIVSSILDSEESKKVMSKMKQQSPNKSGPNTYQLLSTFFDKLNSNQ